MNFNQIIGLISVSIIVIFGVGFLVAHAFFLRKELAKKWQEVSMQLAWRQDLLPNLIETVKTEVEGQSGLIEELIKRRNEASRITAVNLSKLEAEKKLGTQIKEIQGLVKQFPRLGKNTNFLELSSDILKAENRVREATENYNQATRRYNRLIRIPVIGWLPKIFGCRRANVFSFD